MGLKRLLYRSLAEPRLSQIEYAEECLEGENSKVEEYLAAVNMRMYPIVSKDKILQNIREDKERIENDMEALA